MRRSTVAGILVISWGLAGIFALDTTLLPVPHPGYTVTPAVGAGLTPRERRELIAERNARRNKAKSALPKASKRQRRTKTKSRTLFNFNTGG